MLSMRLARLAAGGATVIDNHVDVPPVCWRRAATALIATGLLRKDRHLHAACPVLILRFMKINKLLPKREFRAFCCARYCGMFGAVVGAGSVRALQWSVDRR